MIPYLFPSDALDFGGGGYGSLEKCVSCIVTQELGSTGVYELNMEILTDDPNFQNMAIEKIIVAKPNMTDENQAFVIESMSKPINNVVSVYATHIAQHRTKLIPVDIVNSDTLVDVLNDIGHYSMESNPFNIHTNRSVNIHYEIPHPKSMRSIMGGEEGSILDVFGGEYIYNNFDIELVNRRGRTGEIQVAYGQNMTEFVMDEEFSFETSITGIVPIWYSEGTLVQGSTQYSDYVDYFKYKKTIVKDYTEEFENQPSSAQLNAKALADVKNYGFPLVNTKVAFNEFDSVIKGNTMVMQLGDEVRVINPNYKVNTVARISSMTFNVLAERYEEIQIGNLQPSINESIANIK